MAVSFHVAAVVCVAPAESVPPDWRHAFEALGVAVTRALDDAQQSPGALAKAARDRGLDQLCVLDADADGVRLSLYRALPGGHGELLTAALGDAPADASSASLTSALALRLELLLTSPLGSGAWVPAPPPKPLPPLPADVSLDLASPARAPWPELPVVDLPTPVTARVAGEAPPPSGYELTVDTEAPTVGAPAQPEERAVYAGLQLTGEPRQAWLALGVAAELRLSPLGAVVPVAPTLAMSASPLWLAPDGLAAGPLKLTLSPLARAAPPGWGVDLALGAQVDLWLRLPSAAGEGPAATLTVGPAARIGWTPDALGGARWCVTAQRALPSGGVGALTPDAARAPGPWTLALDVGWPIP